VFGRSKVNGDAVRIGRLERERGGRMGPSGGVPWWNSPPKKRVGLAEELVLWPLRPKAEWQLAYGRRPINKFGSVGEVRGEPRR
jgi:hypothetical protein